MRNKAGSFFITAGVQAFLSLAIASAGVSRAQAAESEKKFVIAASFYPVYIMARNVAGGVPETEVVNLAAPFAGCLHDYALTTDDMKKLAGADILVINGAGMESFIERVALQFPRLKIAELINGIPLIKGAAGDNPHVWVSISYAIVQVKNLGEALAQVDPAHAGQYRSNAGAYAAKLEAFRVKMHAELAPYKGKKIVTFHEAFSYFAREFGLEIAGVVEREPGSSPGAQELAQAIALIKRLGITTIFCEPQYSALDAQAIARETGAKIYMLDPAVTGADDPDAYIRIMERNLETLKEALKEPVDPQTRRPANL